MSASLLILDMLVPVMARKVYERLRKTLFLFFVDYRKRVKIH